jgi:hypothetical protein
VLQQKLTRTRNSADLDLPHLIMAESDAEQRASKSRCVRLGIKRRWQKKKTSLAEHAVCPPLLALKKVN